MEEIRKFLKGKSVAIVGNAKSIFETKHGKDIDRHDVVIRFNKGFITAPEDQGTRTDILILACELNLDEKSSFKAKYYVNRSSKTTCGDYTISNEYRAGLKKIIGKQPSSGYMAINLCLECGCKVHLYGFDWGKTPTYYNPEGYVTRHDYDKEEELVQELIKRGKVEKD